MQPLKMLQNQISAIQIHKKGKTGPIQSSPFKQNSFTPAPVQAGPAGYLLIIVHRTLLDIGKDSICQTAHTEAEQALVKPFLAEQSGHDRIIAYGIEGG